NLRAFGLPDMPDGQQLLHDRPLREGRFEFIVKQIDAVNPALFRFEIRDQSPRDDAGVGRVHFACAGNADMFTANLDGAAAEEVVTFAPDKDKLDFAARVVLQDLLRRFDEVSVETAAETFIGGHQREDQAFYATIAFALMSAEQRVFVIRRAS